MNFDHIENSNGNFREQILNLKIQEVLNREKEYHFPMFMRLIRKNLGFTRRSVADTFGVSEGKMYYLEAGKYGGRGPDYEFITSLAHFYGLNGDCVIKKFKEFMEIGEDVQIPDDDEPVSDKEGE